MNNINGSDHNQHQHVGHSTVHHSEEYYKNINKACICLNLRKATRAATQAYDHLLEIAGIRATQFTLLVTLASVAARTLTEMAAVLVMDRTTLTRNLKPLEKMGLIETISSADKRSRAYGLTVKGKEILARGLPLWEKAQAQVIKSVGEEKCRTLMADLKEVTSKIIDL